MFKYSWNLNKVFESKRKRSWEKIEEIANTSSEEYAAKEIELCNDDGVDLSFDAGWQKRGRSYSSLSGMECDMAVSMLKDLEDKNISVETIVMDDDTTTIARARKF